MEEELKTEQDKTKYISSSYKVIKSMEKIKNGELFLISCDLNNSGIEKNYVLKKIEIKSEKEKNRISNEIQNVINLNSKYSIIIYDYFIEKENQKEFICIIIDYYINGTLESLIKSKKNINSRIIWRIFIQMILGIKSFHDNNIVIENLCPKNIYIDNENNIRIGGYGLILDFTNEEYQNTLTFYSSPEILNGENYTKKSDMWSLGCILYELFFKKKAFLTMECIFQFYYEINDKLEEDFKYILSKLLCYEKKRLLINELLIDFKFKKKLIEMNLFDEIIKPNLKGKYFIIYI